MKLLRRGLAILTVLLALAVAAFAISAAHQRSQIDDRRKQATADAEASAHRYAAKLPPAFTAGPQTIASLEELERGTQVTLVTAAKEGTSVVVDIQATATYPGGRSASMTDACLHITLFRTDGTITDQVNAIPCTQLRTTTNHGEILAVE
ncbi:CBS domain containing-hemolysin-like protein [Kitasatospora sp. MAA19]|uniref:hypothetical protein n=1 Tax=Kitasatospora sp. MAA19 TaxID=3035090 RepID=UPI0024761E8D|nr:hypothetical protein [Kitasatospora sp. MAA19]MDH6711080.1 CBS domain containing-hemolysin-like protein [Kitasatospora sp. MAA19]